MSPLTLFSTSFPMQFVIYFSSIACFFILYQILNNSRNLFISRIRILLLESTVVFASLALLVEGLDAKLLLRSRTVFDWYEPMLL